MYNRQESIQSAIIFQNLHTLTFSESLSTSAQEMHSDNRKTMGGLFCAISLEVEIQILSQKL
jgi:hypothetical protein